MGNKETFLSNEEQTKTEKTVADFLIGTLKNFDVDTYFGVPGGAIEPLYNSLARAERTQVMKIITARHESGAAFMADGYARETGKIAVCCATTGPGTTNIITGVASAFADKIQMLVITGQTSLSKFGKNSLQNSSETGTHAIHSTEMLRHCTVYSSLVSHQNQLPDKLLSAFQSIKHNYGPAHLSIPSDILNTHVENISPLILPEILKNNFHIIAPLGIKKLLETLSTTKNIVIHIGPGAGGAMREIHSFAQKINASIICDPMGKRWIDFGDIRFKGVFGFGGHTSASEALKNADLILAVGCDFGELETANWNKLLMNEKLIHIDAIRSNFIYSPQAKMHIFGNIKNTFEHMNQSLGNISLGNITPATKISFLEKNKCLSNETPIKPQRLMYDLSQRLPKNARVLLDAGNAWSWGTHYLQTKSNNGGYRIAMGYGSMGWAVGAAIGTAIGAPGTPVFCITGDGSYLMSAQEITVAVEHKLPVIFIILNDSSLGMVRHGQALGKAESIAHELPKINFALMGQALGAHGIIIESPADLDKVNYEELGSRPGPTIIDVRIDRDEVPPMGSRVEGLQSTPGQ